ncbi:hypothetical protein CQ010_09170 [Arthrobacter sp. MYb211]|uniref:hypothetical protein n=1 Tax=unclassified Arthrobacter TaxID=235627 RepID=UPI000CFB27FE|nr:MULTISPECIES: hypothetical protein [unclassified Arthrobacter]PRA11490.1 hypothetical protein CQ015_08835 [Arthrobacter sp. MYb221]PRC08009.1 hypothetical protein CQ010_09170 [Arthrobacter sp. MYb211]
MYFYSVGVLEQAGDVALGLITDGASFLDALGKLVIGNDGVAAEDVLGAVIELFVFGELCADSSSRSSA